MNREEIIERRREFKIPGYKTLAEFGFYEDEQWVTPYQIASCSMTGPVLVAHHWLDAPSVKLHRDVLKEKSYLPEIPFNQVLDLALSEAGLDRADIYVTQAFHLLPLKKRSQSIPPKYIAESFKRITRHEVEGWAVIALGKAAEGVCRKACRLGDVRFAYFEAVIHPSARGLTHKHKAGELAEALKRALEHSQSRRTTKQLRSKKAHGDTHRRD